MDVFLTVMRFALGSAVIYLLIAGGLILSQRPAPAKGESLDFDKLRIGNDAVEPVRYTARDGVELAVRVHEGQGAEAALVVLVHGSGAHGAAYDGLAAEIAAMTGAQVLVPDLRGHGLNPAPKGDVAYIGQLEDDLADLVAVYRQNGQKLVLMGHSSGGGLVVRYAGGRYGDALDGAVLLAPYLKYNAPTMRENSGGWAQVLTRRVIGLSMLNTVGIKALNGLTAITFTLPEGPLSETMTGAYSYRLNTSYAPRGDYLADVAALPPFLLIAGTQDEAFKADQFEPVLSGANPQGSYLLLEGVGHLDVMSQPETAARAAEFIRDIE
ncbi:alpha/beta hydrolase [Neptunicoccus cionae]|uniref:Alpha/beta hydrolase n=1 Tax=Neptunicoccus cionae TaxID=2035344 RepID=A0A916QYB4_9RHOB|nr:alpha/beta fold hydrolase [Amylibacter cionae]GGA23260.1 alpha/beta hydrolase [Amylibacter cionae]